MLVHLNVWNARVRDFPSRPVYGVGEQSGIKLRKVVPRISWLLLKGFFWRLREKYVIRDFHPLVFFYALGILIFVGLVLGVVEVDPAPDGNEITTADDRPRRAAADLRQPVHALRDVVRHGVQQRPALKQRYDRPVLKELAKRWPAAYRAGRIVVEARRRRRQASNWTAPYLSPADKVRVLPRLCTPLQSFGVCGNGHLRRRTTYRLRGEFSQLFTVEIDPELARLSRMRFARNAQRDSTRGERPHRPPDSVVRDLRADALLVGQSPVLHEDFRLGLPAVEELQQVMDHHIAGHVALIDDVRLLSGTDGWPTLDELLNVVDKSRFETDVSDDILRVTPTVSADMRST